MSPPFSTSTGADAEGPGLDAGLRAARALGDAGNYRGAVEVLTRLLGRFPEHGPAHTLLGFYLHSLDRNPEAEQACRAAIALDPTDASAHRVFGLVLAARVTGRRQALVHLREAVRLAPEEAVNHYQLAILHTRLTNRRRARESFAKACALAPGNAVFLAGAAECFHLLNRPREARDFAARAFAAGPDTVSALAVEARSRLLAGRIAEARDLAAAALSIEAAHPTALAVLIEADMCRRWVFRVWSRLRSWTSGRASRVAIAVFASMFALPTLIGVATLISRDWGGVVVMDAWFAAVAWATLPSLVFNYRLGAAKKPFRLKRRF